MRHTTYLAVLLVSLAMALPASASASAIVSPPAHSASASRKPPRLTMRTTTKIIGLYSRTFLMSGFTEQAPVTRSQCHRLGRRAARCSVTTSGDRLHASFDAIVRVIGPDNYLVFSSNLRVLR